MNDSEIEDQLRALSPGAPSADLASRIERQLTDLPPVRTAGVIARPARTPRGWRWLRDLGWAVAGATAALALATWFAQAQKSTTPTTRSVVANTAPAPVLVAAAVDDQAFEPTEATRELVSVKNSNEVLDTEDGPVREVRYTYLERLAWAHPGTGARLEIEVPREDVYLLPVSLQ